MQRRNFLRAAGALTFQPWIRASAPKRKLLFIAVDDLNDWAGCMGGNPQALTPNLDRLASRSVLFTNAHCAAPLCNPSRASLLTGIRPSTSGVYRNNQPMRQSSVLKDAVTLPMHFRQNGYRAIGAGKIFHGGFSDPQSWDDYVLQGSENAPGYAKAESNLNGMKRGNFDWGPVDVSDDDMNDGKVAAWAARQLSSRVTDPLFLAAGIYRPHLPWYVPRKYFDLFPLDRIELPSIKNDDLEDVPPMGRKFANPGGDHASVVGAGKHKEAVQAYLASIAFSDAMLGRILRALETGPNANDFSIVLWSDHGWHLGEKLHWRKFTLWEESTRSVLMFSAQGVTRAGARCARPASFVDIYPTLTELCGLPARPGLDGTSLMPQLRNVNAPRAVPAVTTYFRGNHAIRDERYRYIRYSDGGEELYDHSTDPMEWTNLAGVARYRSIKESLAKWLPKADAPDSPSRG